jgi:predicted Zn-dependent peptidase
VVELVSRNMGSGNGVVPGFGAAPALPVERLAVEHRDLAQAHVVIGLPALKRDDPDQWNLEMLNAILGEGSSSRLFQTLREDAGLAYDVHSFQTDYADCGALQIYAGVDPADMGSAVTGILDELRKLANAPVALDELDRARAYTSGRLELRLEESRHLSAWLGVQEALHERVLTLDEVLDALNTVTPDSIQALAQRLFTDDKLCMAVIAPKGTTRNLETSLRLQA